MLLQSGKALKSCRRSKWVCKPSSFCKAVSRKIAKRSGSFSRNAQKIWKVHVKFCRMWTKLWIVLGCLNMVMRITLEDSMLNIFSSENHSHWTLDVSKTEGDQHCASKFFEPNKNISKNKNAQNQKHLHNNAWFTRHNPDCAQRISTSKGGLYAGIWGRRWDLSSLGQTQLFVTHIVTNALMDLYEESSQKVVNRTLKIGSHTNM